MGLKVKLVASTAGASKTQLATVAGLGLVKFGDERILQDTPAVRGMARKVQHLVSLTRVEQAPVLRKRMKPKRIRVRDALRGFAESKA